ncbi:hypothetical protein AAHE18_12G211300 [Arachis hypogaea]
MVKTKFPVSKSLAEALVDIDGTETSEDQRGLRSWSTRFPWLLMERRPEVVLRGVSLLATQTTVCCEMLLRIWRAEETECKGSSSLGDKKVAVFERLVWCYGVK